MTQIENNTLGQHVQQLLITHGLENPVLDNYIRQWQNPEHFKLLESKLAEFLHLAPNGKNLRKIKEALTAIKLERTYSKDEIIHVLDGELQIGRSTVRSGESIAVRKDVRYSFLSPGPYRFLNFRGDIATITFGTSSRPFVVTETVNELRRQSGSLAKYVAPDDAMETGH